VAEVAASLTSPALPLVRSAIADCDIQAAVDARHHAQRAVVGSMNLQRLLLKWQATFARDLQVRHQSTVDETRVVRVTFGI